MHIIPKSIMEVPFVLKASLVKSLSYVLHSSLYVGQLGDDEATIVGIISSNLHLLALLNHLLKGDQLLLKTAQRMGLRCQKSYL